MLEEFFYIHHKIVEDVPLKFRRYLYNTIDWNSHAICVTGARGVGKTTLLLQRYQEQYGDVEKCLYISADNVEISAKGLFHTAKDYFKYGGKALMIDEIHKYSSWQVELKNILDTFKDKKILVSGSSSLGLQDIKADLSRRLVYYDLKGLSLREYLELKEGIVFPAVGIEDILKKHVNLAQRVVGKNAVLRSFKKYLTGGYYPFFVEGESTYLSKILNTIEKVLYEDVTVVRNIKISNVPVLKKILWLVATSEPFTVNIDRMSRDLGISKEYVYSYIEYLEGAGLIHCLRPAGNGYTMVRKPQKILLRNPNLLVAINSHLMSEHEQGIVRETFFVDQIRSKFKVSIVEKGDFLVSDQYTFEVGGAAKSFKQIKNIKNSYVVSDGIEFGQGNKIPLYLFGFLY